MREVKNASLYQHFKGNLYWVYGVGVHTETNEVLVSYQAVSSPHNIYIRPIEMFLEKIEEDREDNITKQKYRFEPYEGE